MQKQFSLKDIMQGIKNTLAFNLSIILIFLINTEFAYTENIITIKNNLDVPVKNVLIHTSGSTIRSFCSNKIIDKVEINETKKLDLGGANCYILRIQALPDIGMSAQQKQPLLKLEWKQQEPRTKFVINKLGIENVLELPLQ